MTNKELRKFYQDLVEPAGELFADPINEITRERQNHLLICSIITILLAKGIIVFVEGSFAGLKFSSVKSGSLILISCFITIYTLAIYSLHLYKDWKLKELNQLNSYAALIDLNNKIEKDLVSKFNKSSELGEKSNALLDLRDQKWKELNLDTTKDLELRFTDRINIFLEYCSNDGLDEAQKEHFDVVRDRSAIKRQKRILATFFETARVDKLRVVSEIMFPVGLGLYAIMSAILAII